ncbi:MAG: hypothetical protein HKN40_13125, partial [Winogradskyella sp.]|uniref:hypothetical protein n=1 Tax=Winogradskyella sp. TaxID=1883156 RepID=UPI0017EE3F7A|nr:hypothetical protein [Winogradskyella sp.]
MKYIFFFISFIGFGQVQTGFDNPTVTIFAEGYTLTAERSGAVYLSDNWIREQHAIITKQP